MKESRGQSVAFLDMSELSLSSIFFLNNASTTNGILSALGGTAHTYIDINWNMHVGINTALYMKTLRPINIKTRQDN